MKLPSKSAIGLVLVGILGSVAGGAATWWLARSGGPSTGEADTADVDMRAFRYISLEKVIVMLRDDSGDPSAHYMALDLVFKTPADNERITREHLPLLRSVAVKSLSSLTVERAGRMTVEELTAEINRAFAETYARDREGKPFIEAMIAKLIIE